MYREEKRPFIASRSLNENPRCDSCGVSVREGRLRPERHPLAEPAKRGTEGCYPKQAVAVLCGLGTPARSQGWEHRHLRSISRRDRKEGHYRVLLPEKAYYCSPRPWRANPKPGLGRISESASRGARKGRKVDQHRVLPKRSVGVLCGPGARRGWVAGLAEAFLAKIPSNGNRECYAKKVVTVLCGLGAPCARRVLLSLLILFA